MESIDQRRFAQQRHAEFTADGVACTWRTPFIRQEYKVRYEDILTDPVQFTDQATTQPFLESLLLAAGLVLGVVAFGHDDPQGRLGAASMACLLVLSAAMIWFFQRWPQRQLLQVSSGESALILFLDKPSDTAVNDFLASLRARRDEYLRNNYGSAAPFESKASQIERLFQLREAGAISEVEYETLKSEVVGTHVAAANSGQYL